MRLKTVVVIALFAAGLAAALTALLVNIMEREQEGRNLPSSASWS